MRSDLVRNRLLDGLPRADRRRLIQAATTVELAFADILHRPGERIATVYFPTRGYVSLVMPAGQSSGVEVGVLGNEGMFGVPIALGVHHSPLRVVVQGAGKAITLGATAFEQQLDESRAFRSAVHRYAAVHLDQLAQMAACMRFHLIDARLARWLLITQDRAEARTFRVTHAALGSMLGVRRAGVTRAAGELQSHGIIRYQRGIVTVLDRAKLKASACGCYDADRASYLKAIGAIAGRQRSGRINDPNDFTSPDR